MRNATILYFLAIYSTYFGNLFVLISLSALVYLYISKGASTFQLQYLHRLIIVKTSGVPVYTHTFRSFDDVRFQDTLFSGAITAIGLIMKEFVGQTEDIQEIELSNIKLIVSRIDESTSTLLLVERSTKTTREMLTNFTTQVIKVFNGYFPNDVFMPKQIKICNAIVEDIFGSADSININD